MQKEIASIDIGYFLRFKGKIQVVCFEAAKVIILKLLSLNPAGALLLIQSQCF
jgi:hypothetical protein